MIISARPDIGVAEGEARDALLARIRGGALAKRATIRDEAVLHGLREHARRVEAELRALRQVLRARGKFGLAQGQVHISAFAVTASGVTLAVKIGAVVVTLAKLPAICEPETKTSL